MPPWLPPPPPPPPAAEEDLVPLWAGEKLDLDFAVSVLLDARTHRTGLPRAAEAA